MQDVHTLTLRPTDMVSQFVTLDDSGRIDTQAKCGWIHGFSLEYWSVWIKWRWICSGLQRIAFEWRSGLAGKRFKPGLGFQLVVHKDCNKNGSRRLGAFQRYILELRLVLSLFALTSTCCLNLSPTVFNAASWCVPLDSSRLLWILVVQHHCSFAYEWLLAGWPSWVADNHRLSKRCTSWKSVRCLLLTNHSWECEIASITNIICVRLLPDC